MDPLARPIAALHAEGRLRVWSLVITVFGDAVAPRGGRIATARLQALLERLGVEPGALRTALSRLAADGWLIREREGRASHYRLSEKGLAEFGPATARIYAPPAPPVTEWTLALGPAPEGALPLGGEAWLLPGSLRDAAAPALAVTGGLAALSEAGRATLCPTDLAAALAALWADLDALAKAETGPLDAMAARVLLIHRWRRIVLRWPERPAELLPAPFSDPGPRARVAAAYARLLHASEAWLDGGGLSPMPPYGKGLARRFSGA